MNWKNTFSKKSIFFLDFPSEIFWFSDFSFIFYWKINQNSPKSGISKNFRIRHRKIEQNVMKKRFFKLSTLLILLFPNLSKFHLSPSSTFCLRSSWSPMGPFWKIRILVIFTWFSNRKTVCQPLFYYLIWSFFSQKFGARCCAQRAAKCREELATGLKWTFRT